MTSRTSMLLGPMLGLALLVLSLSLGQPTSAHEFANLYARNTSFVPTSTTSPRPCPTWAPWTCPVGQAPHTTYSAGCQFPAGCTTPTSRPCPTPTPPLCSAGYGTGYITTSSCSFPTCTRCPVAAITPCATGQTTVYRTTAGCTFPAGCSTPVPTGQILWGQCGGNGWTGPRTCAEGKCVCYNEWYCESHFILNAASDILTLHRCRPMHSLIPEFVMEA